jgi:hypothetical protein
MQSDSCVCDARLLARVLSLEGGIETMTIIRQRASCALWSAVCVVAAACGSDSGVGVRPPGNISGNWYFIDPSAPPAAGQINEIGAGLLVKNGIVTGNATVAITNDNGQCSSFGLDLPMTGTADSGRLSLRATDSTVTLTVKANLGADDTSFVDGSYSAAGAEAYPLFARNQLPCSTATGKLNGFLMPPVNATYSGTLTNGATSVQVRLVTEQDTVPITGPWNNPQPAIILRGHTNFLVGGFFVTGTMQLTSPACGTITGIVQPEDGYVWGTVLQVEFDADTTYKSGAVFSTLIDPETGALTVVNASVYNNDGTPQACYVFDLTGTLARE